MPICKIYCVKDTPLDQEELLKIEGIILKGFEAKGEAIC